LLYHDLYELELINSKAAKTGKSAQVQAFCYDFKLAPPLIFSNNYFIFL